MPFLTCGVEVKIKWHRGDMESQFGTCLSCPRYWITVSMRQQRSFPCGFAVWGKQIREQTGDGLTMTEGPGDDRVALEGRVDAYK